VDVGSVNELTALLARRLNITDDGTLLQSLLESVQQHERCCPKQGELQTSLAKITDDYEALKDSAQTLQQRFEQEVDAHERTRGRFSDTEL